MKEKLIESNKEAFGRGWILRCNRAEYPYESKVEFMIRENGDSPSGYSLIVISGYKAGITFQNLPTRVFTSGEGHRKRLVNVKLGKMGLS